MAKMASILSNKISTDTLQPGDHIYSWRGSFVYAHHGICIGDDTVIHFTRGPGQETGTGTGFDQILFSSSSISSSRAKHEMLKICDACLRLQKGLPLEGVTISCLNCFLDGGQLYRFVYSVTGAMFLGKIRGGTCTMAQSDPPHEVIHRAKYLLEHGFGSYDLFKNNCEDFAIYCKTGLVPKSFEKAGRSGQIYSIQAGVNVAKSYHEGRSNVPAKSNVVGFLSAGLTAVTYFVNRYEMDMGVRKDVVKMPVEEFVEKLQ